MVNRFDSPGIVYEKGELSMDKQTEHLTRDIEIRFWERFGQACRLGQDLQLRRIAQQLRSQGIGDDVVMRIRDMALDATANNEVAALLECLDEVNTIATDMRYFVSAQEVRAVLQALLDDHVYMRPWDED